MRCTFAIFLIALSIMLAPCAIAGTPRLNIPWKSIYSDTDQDFTNSGRREEIGLKFAYELAEISGNEVEIPQTLDKLAVFYCRNDRFREAENMFIKAIEALKICRGDKDINVATEFQRLAVMYQRQGLSDYEDEANQCAWYSMRKAGAKGTFGMAVFLHNRAWMSAQRGAFAASERDYKSSFKIISRTVSGDNILSALTANNLAEVLSVQGKYKDAEHWFKKTIAILKASGSDAITIQEVVNDYLDVLAIEHRKHGVMQAYSLKLLQ